MYRLEFELPGLPKTTNGSHGSWWNASKERKKWRNLSALAAIGKKPLIPLKHVRLILTRFSSSEPDYDNLAISFKSVVDGLKDAGIIVDDKKSVVLERKYLWERIGMKQGKIRVVVEEMNEVS